MLVELNINNFALIDNTNIKFNEGLNILIGETGAGKSILIDALNVALGGRATKEYIRSNRDNAMVQAVFDISKSHEIYKILDDYGIEKSDLLIFTRELKRNGQNISRINSTIVPNFALQDISSRLVDIFGQFEQRSLNNYTKQLTLIDNLAKDDLKDLKDDYKSTYENYKSYLDKYEKLNIDDLQLTREKEMLRFQIEEISRADLENFDEEEFDLELNLQENLSEFKTDLSQALELISSYNGENDLNGDLQKLLYLIQNCAKYNKDISKQVSRVESIIYELEDINYELRDIDDTIAEDPSLLAKLLKKLDQINELKLKYGQNISDIIDFEKDIIKRYEELENIDSIKKEITHNIDKSYAELKKLAQEISKIRKSVAKSLQEKMINELKDLNMENSIFKIDFSKTEIKPNGSDSIKFMISTNLGEEPKDFTKIASGGEISRLMLGFKTIMAKYDNIKTFIFDEIDTGISGNAAKVVSKKIKQLSENRQIICISHLPQIIAAADTLFLIYKTSKDNHTSSNVRLLDYENSIIELARLIEGDAFSKSTLKTAESMIKNFN